MGVGGDPFVELEGSHPQAANDPRAFNLTHVV